MSKKAFTLIEVLTVIAIIGILAAAIIIGIINFRGKARMNGAKTAARTALPIVLACKDGGGSVNVPAGSEDGQRSICVGADFSGSNWPHLENGYQYSNGLYDSANCNFEITTNGDSAVPLTCNCKEQRCQ